MFGCTIFPPDSLSGLGPAEEISAQLEMSVGGGKEHLLSTLPLRAVMGVARLSVPKSLQVRNTLFFYEALTFHSNCECN